MAGLLQKQTVLLPIDGSDCARLAVKWAVTTLPMDSTEFILLYVIVSNEGVRKDSAEYVNIARQTLLHTEQHVRELGATVKKSIHKIGSAVSTICMVADEEQVDLVVLGSHGRSGVAKMVMGSVSEGVLEKCQRPIVVYKTLQGRVDPNEA
ncbi:MAG: universal stress protein [Cyanobacteria bacterium HKST-UBA04]|nr:universal stress protein [Cyanobacteria bacterium HKST-UBA05]MCA9798743.1 universal stress protein [Cyanobacteria bacterium HKST-UBA04]MCA9842221.1 universal stress protein [Cyanobacteria bacterium HKST-UBA03]